jgi:MFS superfamily sulfate permease-like transporter
VVFDMESVGEIDTSGTDALERLRQDLLAAGTSTVLARVHAQILDYLNRIGSRDVFGDDTVFPSVRDAVQHHT